MSREFGVEIYRLEQWRDKALLGVDEAMKDRTGDPVRTCPNVTKRQIGELSMEVELLRRERDLRRPLPGKTLWR